MKIRMKMDVLGTFHGMENVRAGDEVDVDPDEEAVRYCALGYAEPVTKTAEKAEERVVENVVSEDNDVPEPDVTPKSEKVIEDKPRVAPRARRG